jgi:hypothetical protein
MTLDGLPEIAIELALNVAESESNQAGPNIARVLAAVVRRLQRDLDLFRDAGEAAELHVVKLRARVATLESELTARVWAHDSDQATLLQIEQTCAGHGYEPDSGQFVGDWIDATIGGKP